MSMTAYMQYLGDRVDRHFSGPSWLDSDPLGLRKPIDVSINDDQFQVTAVGGFCAPSLVAYSFGFHTPTDHERFLSWQQRREAELAAQRLIPRAKRWWRAHWWPAIIADLTAQLRDEDYYD